jgi:hypothetical protein
VSNYSNVSFLSVRLLIWKPVACLKSAIISKIAVTLQLPVSLVCPRPYTRLILTAVCIAPEIDGSADRQNKEKVVVWHVLKEYSVLVSQAERREQKG